MGTNLNNYLPLVLMTFDIEVYFKNGIESSDLYSGNTSELICIGGGISNIRETNSIKFCITKTKCHTYDNDTFIITVNEE